ncbi:leucyl aminopeptidase family protein [Alphaproteobacteria bacterium GH1-50]|uniref:Leucyl aminopeptidase family protein n=1 Tax=Kangsaoukella pontilimi TaxID=2691042 RepID=A0A7C9MLN8_9RHOB|nr:leucyl aminopeptidase family protein [Kangsaoukella pontilimi]MXQ09395.1 leucyl aminopeptidase family protein [Kangsaoukella pontilimi]
MTHIRFADPTPDALPLHLVTKEAFKVWVSLLDAPLRAWVEASGFKANAGQVVLFPGPDGAVQGAVGGLGGEVDRKRGRFHAARVRAALPAGTWALANELPAELLEECALAWCLAGYSFGRYKDAKPPEAALVAPEGIDRARIERIAAAEARTRDLINTPANDMGPAELEAAARALAEEHGATITVTTGDALLDGNFPLIHTVGRAATRAPRLIDLRWGDTGPAITLVGKGVCFDTGGLNLKPAASMALMKKDMGGAANVIGLAHMIMDAGTPCRLRVLIPAVENAVAGDAFRPGDILPSRKGLTVEINNTDAEGRLVLADALALADEEKPDLIISMATLTGAARVAVGPDLAPFYATDDGDAAALSAAADRVRDPVWRMPFWDPYETMIEPGIADLDNAPKGGFAGSITAALFLRRFVTDTPRYMHFDVFGWSPSAEPARPKGGVGQGIRAIEDALPGLLDI